MDQIIAKNKEQWNRLALAGVQHSKPFYGYTVKEAKEYCFRYGIISDVKGLNILCLAGGGGQDSVAFGLLGANVTVFDLSDVQLSRDTEAASHFGLEIKTIQGNMTDLSQFSDCSFDIVWQPYSLNYSPVIEPVFKEVARVLRNKGKYFVAFANPFVQALDGDSWNGRGYELKGLYADKEDVTKYVPEWEVTNDEGETKKVESPHQFRHRLSSVLNSLVKNRFSLLYLNEWMRNDEKSEPGSWAHFTQSAPPWFDSFWELNK